MKVISVFVLLVFLSILFPCGQAFALPFGYDGTVDYVAPYLSNEFDMSQQVSDNVCTYEMTKLNSCLKEVFLKLREPGVSVMDSVIYPEYGEYDFSKFPGQTW